MEPTDLRTLTWQKSSHSKKLECIEVARTTTAVAVRDSKDPNGPTLLIPTATFARFLHSLR
jgi:hypothetical protein